MNNIDDIDFRKIDLESYKKDIEELNIMCDELWEDEEIRKAYFKRRLNNIEEELKDIKENYVDLAQQLKKRKDDFAQYIKNSPCINDIGKVSLLRMLGEIDE